MVNAKRKTRDLPKLPADHLTLYADQIHSLHVEKQNDAEWLLLIYLKDNRALRIWIGARSARLSFR